MYKDLNDKNIYSILESPLISNPQMFKSILISKCYFGKRTQKGYPADLQAANQVIASISALPNRSSNSDYW